MCGQGKMNGGWLETIVWQPLLVAVGAQWAHWASEQHTACIGWLIKSWKMLSCGDRGWKSQEVVGVIMIDLLKEMRTGLELDFSEVRMGL